MKFSIVIPFFNDSKNLETLKITLNDYVYNSEVEIIIVDDCSKDEEYKKILEEFEEYDNIHIYRNEVNSGPSASRMNGVAKSTGDYIFFLDSDDGWIKNKAYKEYEYCLHNNIVLSGSNSKYIDKKDFIRIRNEENKLYFLHKVTFVKSLWKNPYATSSVCVKRDVILKYPFNRNIRYSEDVECWRRILIDFNGIKFRDTSYMFKHPYLSENGLSANTIKMSIGSTAALCSLIKRKKVKNNHKLLVLIAIFYSILKSVFRVFRKILRKRYAKL